MTTDINGRKICPRCYQQYYDVDNYCGNDGARLVTIDFNNASIKPRPEQVSNSGARAEKS